MSTVRPRKSSVRFVPDPDAFGLAALLALSVGFWAFVAWLLFA